MNNETNNVPAKESFFEKMNTFFHSKKWKAIWDKITTGILIALMCTPVAILAYIIIWFLCK